MKNVLALVFSVSQVIFAAEQITYTKSFPGSKPEFVSVVVSRDCSAEYKEALAEDHPVTVVLPKTDVDSMFDLASKLDHFKGKIESGLKVANTGKKTLRYQSADGNKTEAVYNYSLDTNAQQLQEKFEQIAESERAYLELDQAIHFDKLGVNDALAQIEQLWLDKKLTAPKQFIPLFTRIVNHDSFMHLARERAARLKDNFALLP